MNYTKSDSGAEAQEQVTKIVLYVRDSKLPDEVKNIISDAIGKEQYRQILEALLKVQIERGTNSKTVYIPPVKKTRRIQIRRKDLAWIDKTKGLMSRSGWMHHIINAYKKSISEKPE